MADAAAMAVRIAVVGDVHDDWDSVQDAKALHHLKPDVVLFTGDFGNENVDVVRDISKLNLPKAAILGNHDCWWTLSSFTEVFTYTNFRTQNPKQKSGTDAVQEQLDLLGDTHVGFGRLDFPDLHLSVVGGRPFSMGGGKIHSAYNPFKLLAPRYGVHNFQESAEWIQARAKEAPRENSLVFLAHNGPRGLGSKVEDICGRDWVDYGGDHGDPDFEEAIAGVKREGLQVPLVVFGHMHRDLQCTAAAKRTMLVAAPDGTVYLNAAVVPRVRGAAAPELAVLTQRHFALVEFQGGRVDSVHEVWVTVGEDKCESKHTLVYSCNSSAVPPEVISSGRSSPL